jgi:hypothetical protein
MDGRSATSITANSKQTDAPIQLSSDLVKFENIFTMTAVRTVHNKMERALVIFGLRLGGRAI